MIRLQLTLEGQPLMRYEYAEGAQAVIGRQPGTAVHLNDPGVSREHCRISHQPGRGWLVEDLGSSNGTYVNRRKVEAAQVLHDDDVVTVGRYSLVVTTGTSRGKGEETVGWRLTAESAERTAPRKAHLASERPQQPPILIQQDALRLGAAPRCEVRVGTTLPLVAILIRGYGGFQVLNVGAALDAVRVNGAPVPDRAWLKDEDRLEVADQVWTFHAGLPEDDSLGTVQMDKADLEGLFG